MICLDIPFNTIRIKNRKGFLIQRLMCGVTGLLCSTTSNNITRQVAKMTSLLVHRGPNDEGVWSDGNIGLGQRRLAILDLTSSGAQPMKSECGRYVLVYNGEIYNHFELNLEKIIKKIKEKL